MRSEAWSLNPWNAREAPLTPKPFEAGAHRTKIESGVSGYCYESISVPLASLVAWSVKNLPAVQETQVPSLGWEDPLEEEMATHSSILAWRIPWKRSLAGYSPWGGMVGLD